MRKLLTDCFTGADGTTFDLGRVLWAMSFVVGLTMEAHSACAGVAFDLQAYGIGIGSLLLAGGGALNLKARTEPGPT